MRVQPFVTAKTTFDLKMWSNEHSIVQILLANYHINAKDYSFLFACVFCLSMLWVFQGGKGKQGLPIILLLASKSTQTQTVLTFNPLDLKEMS